MASRVYIETSVISYLTSLPSRNVSAAAHQQITHAWWATRDRFTLHVSEAVLAEAASGDPDAARRRVAALAGIPVLAINQQVLELAAHFLQAGALPAKAEVDAVHVAAAAIHGMDFLATWNCAHIANAVIRARLESLCRTFRLEPQRFARPRSCWDDLCGDRRSDCRRGSDHSRRLRWVSQLRLGDHCR